MSYSVLIELFPAIPSFKQSRPTLNKKLPSVYNVSKYIPVHVYYAYRTSSS